MLNPLSKEAREVVWGSLFGDGGVYYGTGNRHCCFKVSHSPRQIEYLKWKYQYLKPVVASRIYSVTAWHKRNKKEYTTLHFTTGALSFFTRLRKIFYPQGKKLLRRKLLNKLTPLGLATWFMDDGTTAVNNRNYPQLFINVCSCSPEETSYMKDYFQEKFGIRVLVHGGKYPRLYFNKPNALKFIEIIYPHIIPSMMYKLRYFYKPSLSEKSVEDIV